MAGSAHGQPPNESPKNTSNEQLLDPVRNMRITWRISKGGRDWSPWSCARIIGLA